MAKPKADTLTREGTGSWRTKDGRFLIKGESGGHWYLVDDARRDPFGLELVTGPYPTISAARDAIAEALAGSPEDAPGPGARVRAEQHARASPRVQGTPDRTTRSTPDTAPGRRTAAPEVRSEPPPRSAPGTRTRPAAIPAVAPGAIPAAVPVAPMPAPVPAPPPEPDWLAHLAPPERRAARRAIAELERLGIDHAASVVRRDVTADIPEVAHALLRRLLGAIAERSVNPAAAREVLAEAMRLLSVTGRDIEATDGLPGWRLVETREGRPARRIMLEAGDLEPPAPETA